MIAKWVSYIFCLFVVLIISGCAYMGTRSFYDSAYFRGDLDKVKKALAEGVDVNQKNTRFFDETPLHQAAAGGHLETIKYLISNGADITQKDYFGRTALHYAAWSEGNSLEVVQYLLSVGADLTK